MSDPHPCVAVPPDQATPGAYCVCCGKPTRVPDADWITDAGGYCRRGFARSERFQTGTEQVIPGTNRAKSRALRRANTK